MNIFHKFFDQNTYFSVSKHSASFSLFYKKIYSGCVLGIDQPPPPSPFTDRSPTSSFFYAFPQQLMSINLVQICFSSPIPLQWKKFYRSVLQTFHFLTHSQNNVLFIGKMPFLGGQGSLRKYLITKNPDQQISYGNFQNFVLVVFTK